MKSSTGMKMKVISGIHKGTVGKIVSEKEKSFEIKSGSTVIIVHKDRCAPYSEEDKVTEFKSSGRGKVLSFRPKLAVEA